MGANKLIIATSVDGSTPPIRKKIPKRRDRQYDPRELSRMAAQTEMKAGSPLPVDPLAAKIIERSRIPPPSSSGKNRKPEKVPGGTGTEIRQG